MKIAFAFLFVYLCALIATIKSEKPSKWEFFKRIYKKNYKTPEEEETHRKKFEEAIARIREHNELYRKGQTSYKQSINKFADFTKAEFAPRLNGLDMSLIGPNPERSKPSRTRFIPPPSVDWRLRGINTTAKDQGDFCASCWAFVATAAIEAQEKIAYGRSLDLSEQNLVDCANSTWNMGCLGGHMLHAFNYTTVNKGLSLRMFYPYEGMKGGCRYKKVFSGGVYVSRYKRLPRGDEEALKEAVAFVGPIASSIDAVSGDLKYYYKGIYYDKQCNSSRLTHAVLVMGYGTEDGQDYWLIKNSYGPYWGDKGYFKLARNKDNHCGIASAASYPIISSNLKPY